MCINVIVPILMLLFFTEYVQWSWCDPSEFNMCQEDPTLNPPDGVLKEHTFPWLGFIQYIHVKTNLPHQSIAPRVIHIQKQFVIGTASSATNAPRNYKFGDVIFGDYEPDEEECNLTYDDVKQGIKCSRAYLVVPILEIIPHPEHSRFGIGNSIALIKLIVPIKSLYMVPICLPSIQERIKKKKNKVVYLIDYINTVPKDFDAEYMAKKSLTLILDHDCKKYKRKSKASTGSATYMLCSSGCGIRPGAPIVSRSFTGRYELVGLAIASGASCFNQAMRNSLNTEPPLYIDVFPYLNWIINMITAHHIPNIYPVHFHAIEGGSRLADKPSGRGGTKCGWNGHMYYCGELCFKNFAERLKSAFFYHETFTAIHQENSELTLDVTVSGGYDCKIECAAVKLPSSLIKPVVHGLHTHEIRVTLKAIWSELEPFHFTMSLYGKNNTKLRYMPDREMDFLKV